LVGKGLLSGITDGVSEVTGIGLTRVRGEILQGNSYITLTIDKQSPITLTLAKDSIITQELSKNSIVYE